MLARRAWSRRGAGRDAGRARSGVLRRGRRRVTCGSSGRADAAARRSRRRPSSTLPPRLPPVASPSTPPRLSGLEVVPPPDTDPDPACRSPGRPARTSSGRTAPARPSCRRPVPRTQVPEARTREHDAAPRTGSAPPTPPRGVGRWVDPGAMAAQEAQRARSGMVSSGIGALGDDPTDLSSARLLRPMKRPPQSGWRRLVYVLSGKLINPGESPADIRRRELIARINAPLLGCHKIALLSLKGGVGKTTMTATLGATFASLRGDRVVAVDANPDRGTLSQKIPLRDQRDGAAPAARRRARDALHRRPRLHLAGPTRGWRCSRASRTRRCPRPSAREDYRRTVEPARALLQHGAHRLRHRPDALGDVRRAGRGGPGRGGLGRPSTAPAAPSRRWTGSTRTGTATWSATRSP